MGIFDSVIKRNRAIQFSYDYDLLRETSHKAYVKKWALDTCINHIARTISQTKFEIETKGEKDKTSTTYYKLNVRPNTDESAATFWQKVVRKLIYDNEVLIIVTDTKDLVVADDFVREPYALYDDVFKNVLIEDYEFERTFKMGEVIYLEYNNESINNMLYGLFSDYGDIFGRLIASNLLSNQIRGTVEMDGNMNLKEANTEQMQNFINKSYEAFAKNDIAIVPMQKGYTYKEHASQNQSKNSSQVDDLAKIPNQLLSYVARNLGIPVGLINGDTADIEGMTSNYMKFCINPIIEKILDELNAKLCSEQGYKNGKRIRAISIDQPKPIDKAEAFDKLIASGGFTRNEVREMAGYERSDDPEMDKFVITKNYQSVEEQGDNESNNKEEQDENLKGGEDDED